jgi:Carboxypeptidase regulatory-like domain
MQLAVSKNGVAGGLFRFSNLKYLPFLFLLLCLVPAASYAQNATIVGTVTDPSGAVMPNVNVTVTNTETSWMRTIPTNDSGQYVVPDVPIGRYTVKAEASGFKGSEQKDVVVQVGDRLRIDFQMKVGTSAETVTVEANAIAVQADSGELSSVITSQQVSQIAVNGRSIYQLAALTPGASSQINNYVNTPVGGDANVAFNGLRQNHNIYLLDGGENDDRGGAGGMSIAPSSDAIAEFRALTSNYSAEYGLSSAATMTMALKSGTSTLHASAWEFNRNDYFDAHNFFRPSHADVLRLNVFGFNVGGPVTFGKLYNPEKKKTFFFYNMEWRRLIQAGSTNQNVPDPATYDGDFSSLSTPINVPSASQVASSVLFQNCPGGVAPAGIAQGSPFPGNQIPSCMINANSTALVNAGIFPEPNTTTANGIGQFRGGANTPTNLKEEVVRIDHNFNSKFSVFGHFIAEQVSQGFSTSQWSGDNVPTVGDTFGNPSYSAVVHATHTISPTLLNEIAFNYNGNRINIIPFASGSLNSLSASDAGFTGARLFTGPNNLDRIPNIDLNGGTGAKFEIASWPWNNKADDYQIRDDISWTKGSHQLRFGGSWAIYKKVQDLFGTTQGGYGFDGTFTGSDFADFLLGTAKSYNELAVQDHGYWNNVSWALYVQDNWRATRRLTLNLGLRWDGVPHTYEANNRMGNFYPELYDPALAATFNNSGTICGPTDNAASGCPAGASPGLGTSPNPILAGVPLYLNGIGIPGKNGIPKGLVDNHWGAFGPRIGFAYDLTGSGRTVVRGGFGMMYERIQGNDMYDAGPNIPFSLSVDSPAAVPFGSPSLALSTGSAATFPINPSSITGLDRDNYKLPVSYQWSLGIQRSLSAKSVLSVTYVGNTNRFQSYRVPINLPDLAGLPAIINSEPCAPADAGTAACGNFNQALGLTYPGFKSINISTNQANSHYNGLQVDLNSQIGRDLYLRAFYTYSRAIDSAADSRGPGGADLSQTSNPYLGWRYDTGPSGFDRTHNAAFNFIYDIPVFRHTQNRLVRSLVGGWQVSGIAIAESGVPVDLHLGGKQSNNGIPNANNRPDLVGKISYPHTDVTCNPACFQQIQYIDPSVFGAPAIGEWGNLGHYSIRGPGRHNWNLSLFKSFWFNEERGSRIELRLESFNTWNHTQFNGVDNTVSFNYDPSTKLPTTRVSNTFGRFNSAFDPRILQLGIKAYF